MRLSWYPSLVCARVVRIIVSVSPIAAATTKYSGKDHRGNQDGVGDSKYQYKDKMLMMLKLLSSFSLLSSLLMAHKNGEREMCVCARARTHTCTTRHYY